MTMYIVKIEELINKLNTIIEKHDDDKYSFYKIDKFNIVELINFLKCILAIINASYMIDKSSNKAYNIIENQLKNILRSNVSRLAFLEIDDIHMLVMCMYNFNKKYCRIPEHQGTCSYHIKNGVLSTLDVDNISLGKRTEIDHLFRQLSETYVWVFGKYLEYLEKNINPYKTIEYFI